MIVARDMQYLQYRPGRSLFEEASRNKLSAIAVFNRLMRQGQCEDAEEIRECFPQYFCEEENSLPRNFG